MEVSVLQPALQQPLVSKQSNGKPTVPRPPVATKPKKLVHANSTDALAVGVSAVTVHNNKPIVKPKPKNSPQASKKAGQTSPVDSTNKKSPFQQESSTSETNQSPRVSPAGKKKLQPVFSNSAVNAEIIHHLSNKNKASDDTNDNTKRPAPPKVLSRKPSPKQKGTSPTFNKKPASGSTISSPTSSIGDQDEDSVYEIPSKESVKVDQQTSNHNSSTVEASDYETPSSITDLSSDAYQSPDNIYARLDESYETRPTAKNTANCQQPETYEVPVSTECSSTNNSSTGITATEDDYETPDIESVRMIQAQLSSNSSAAAAQNMLQEDEHIPPPPSMSPPKPTQHHNHHSSQKHDMTKAKAVKKLPSLSLFKQDSSKAKDNQLTKNKQQTSSGSNGYTKAKGLQFSGKVITKEGLIYEEVKPKTSEPEQDDEYIDLSHLLPITSTPNDSVAPPLPPPRKNQIMGVKSPSSPLVKTNSPLELRGGVPGESNSTGEMLELTEDDEYVDMSCTAPPPSKANTKPQMYRAASDSRFVSSSRSTEHQMLNREQPECLEESDGIYEQMDISRPVPPPRKKKNKHTARTVRNAPLKRINPPLTPSLSFDSMMDENYVTMHRSS